VAFRSMLLRPSSDVAGGIGRTVAVGNGPMSPAEAIALPASDPASWAMSAVEDLRMTERAAAWSDPAVAIARGGRLDGLATPT